MTKDILRQIIKMLSFQESTAGEGFILRENCYDQEAVKQPSGGGSGDESEQRTGVPGAGPADGNKAKVRSPGKIRPSGPAKVSPGSGDTDRVQADLDKNREIIERIYGMPENNDLIMREFTIGTKPPLRAFMVFIDGMVSRSDLNSLLQSLMVFTRMFRPEDGKPASFVMESLIPGSQVRMADSFQKVIQSVNYGDTAFFFDGSASALLVETKGWEHRGVNRPEAEQTLTGPQEAFVENLRANTALVRKIVRSENLQTEIIGIGVRIRSDVAVMYLKDLANPGLVAEVKRRISNIKVDFVNDTGMLEQFIEDSPHNPNPQTLITERPDRVAAALAEGRVAVLLSGSPTAMVVPVTMYELLHTGEETYLRWEYGTFIRYIRNLSFYLALLLPGAYLAIVMFHQEMVPTELLLAIAGNRERVPFPTIVEMLLMEFSFELVREAGLRIPGIIGSTIGIVGALILGQAAVQANIVSPILVILVAVTGLASFSIPNYSLAFAVRIYRFLYIILGATMGFFGITFGLFIQILITSNLKSFGVPYLSPSGPRTYAGPDVVYRLPLFMHRRRPDYLNPRDDVRQADKPRGWLNKGGGGSAGNR